MKSNISVHATIAVVIAFTLANSASAGVILSDFDDGTMQGWTKFLPFGGTLSNPGTGGNPGGWLLATDSVPRGGGLYVLAPASYTGDLSVFAGIQWDEYVFVRGAGGISTVRATELYISGGPNFTTYRSADNSITVLGQWHTRTLTFDPSNFVLETAPGGPLDSFATVIGNTTQLLIQLDTSTLANGGPESGFDNVTLFKSTATVPEPSSLAFFSVMSLGIISWRAKRQR